MTRRGLLLLGAACLLATGRAPLVSAQGVPRQAVVETSAGTFIIDLAPETAPNQTAYFIKTAQEGGYDGTTFHFAVRYGMVQGGDPLSKDPSKQAQYGTGGLNAVKAEARAAKMTRGSVAAVLVPGKPDSAGAQFFIVLADQPALDDKYTVFGHVSEGMETLMKISETPVDARNMATERAEIRKVTIRDTPPVLFVNDSARSSPRIARCSRRAPGRSRSNSSRTRRRRRCDSSSVLPRPACTTAWRSTALRRAS